ncbi:sigma-54-dependent transcriptional regulator, partial [candidate division KSB1 bacterium]
EKSYDLVITDIKMPNLDGMSFMKKASVSHPETFFIIITAYGSLETAVQALHAGAYDYILKPLEFDEVLIRIKKLFEHKKLMYENKILRQEIQEKYDYENIIGKNPIMKEVFKSITKVAKTDGNVLITGKSGTGKELIAKALHYNSSRSAGRFVAINCGAISENLVESELFGYKKGAFTGAIKDKDGFFKVAHKGTLLLDEIGVVPLNVQAKLLRAIETKEIIPVGETTPINVDVRIITATNLDLQEAIKEEKFRLDLYYRLNVIEIKLPSLSERREDIPLLVNHFVRKFSLEMNKPIKSVDNETMKILMNYKWKGEIRELENIIERAIIFTESDIITPKDLPANMYSDGESMHQEIPELLKDAMKIYERNHISAELLKNNNNKEITAKTLGISISSLYRKIEELGIPLK